MAPLYARRKQLRDREDRERRGESFWTDRFSDETRNRLLLIMRSDLAGDYRVVENAVKLLLADLGTLRLYLTSEETYFQFFRYLSECDDDMVPSVIEAIVESYRLTYQEDYARGAFTGLPQGMGRGAFGAELTGEINRVLAEDRIAFELVKGEMVPFASRELHVQVVEPVLRLLATPGWERVEKSYQSALSEIARGDGADAITDAGTALQEALSFLGAQGNQIGDLTTSARSKGLIAAHDVPLLQAVDKACRWVAADRSNMGDAHNADDASRDDAWFTVHVVGAILLRLSRGGRAG